jgi:parvulin-like peptidyl-prolyl isomerase
MAKRRVKKEVPLTRKQVSRREKERRQRLIMIGIAASIGCLIVGILAYGFYVEQIVKPSEPVAVVNGVPIPTETYEKRVLHQRMGIDRATQELLIQRAKFDPEEEQDQFVLQIIDQQLSQLALQRTQVDSEGFVDELIQEELTRQAAEEQGVAVSSEEIDRRIEEYFGYQTEQPTPVPSPPTEAITGTAEMTPTVAPTPMTRERFDELYSEYLTGLQETIGMSEAEYREMVKAELLREKMENLITEQVPTTELQIRARHILLDTRAEAEVVLKNLEEGEDFAALAEELSKDPGSAELGGDLGWFPRGQMVPEFEEVAFSLEPGELSDVVETPFGVHIILVEERDEDRELDAAMLNQRMTEAFQTWLFDLEAAATIEKYWSKDKLPLEQ